MGKEKREKTVCDYSSIFWNHIEGFRSKMDNIDEIGVFWDRKTRDKQRKTSKSQGMIHTS